ncbi:hypothetical protein HBI25_089920 [Parastagonospora nodorum]|nr:hypothetical protein HBH95_007180 [Parastagonospora nodorum]KAH5563249.1 hypothetical protein HBI25_089920 [Parastagonospora nodorum]KAH6324262.1 hypothetical protein HBI37_223050 [Parastagonospora nodorum]
MVAWRTDVIMMLNRENTKSTCYWENGYAGVTFKCTRELGVCRILGYTTEPWKSGYSKITNLCIDLHRSRTMLIPLTVIGAAVLSLGCTRLVLEKRASGYEYESADKRVERAERLQRE